MEHDRILVIQTAFLGDVILTLPMIRKLKENYPGSAIDVVTTPKAGSLLTGHPDIANVIAYDKRGAEKGIKGIFSMARRLRQNHYSLAVVPHRSFRSSLVTALSKIPVTIGFANASGKFLYSKTAEYLRDNHEIERNIHLLSPLGISNDKKIFPALFPSADDSKAVDALLRDLTLLHSRRLIAIAPGSVWNTKRWPASKYAELSNHPSLKDYHIIIIGGKEDTAIGKEIADATGHNRIHDATGKLSLLESAELIRRCSVLVTNDSAPLHIATATATPIVAIFGATVPEFGFGPYRPEDIVVETKGLECRPCAIHGGDECPIGTFICMHNINADQVAGAVIDRIQRFEA